MSNYTKLTAFDIKDALTTGDPLKRIKGTELDDEFDAISTAIATKLDSSGLTASAITTALGTTAVTNATNATNAVNATNATNLVTTNFTVQESGGKLIFKYGSTTIASMDSSGVFTTLSDITAGGTP